MEPAKTHGIYTVLTSSASETVVFAAFCNTTLYTTTLIVLLLQKQQQLLLLLPLLRIYNWPNYSDLSEVTEINFEIDDLACVAVIPDFVAMEKNFWGPEQFFPPPCPRHIFEPLVPQKPTKLLGAPKVFSAILSQSHIRTPGPTKADKTFQGPKSFFPRCCPRHIFEPLVPQKPTKLSGAPKVFFHDPVPVTYSNPWSHKSRQNFPGPQKFFSMILSTRPPDLDNFLFQP